MERKLAAIFSADVKGYSRLMGDDEIATVRTLTAYREVMTALIHTRHGRVVDSPGDNLLAEFASVVDAVQCATEIQQELTMRDAELPTHRQMAFRSLCSQRSSGVRALLCCTAQGGVEVSNAMTPNSGAGSEALASRGCFR
jgi:hypothetical protein